MQKSRVLLQAHLAILEDNRAKMFELAGGGDTSTSGTVCHAKYLLLPVDFGLAGPLESVGTLGRLALARAGTTLSLFALAFVKLGSLPRLLALSFSFATLLGSRPRCKQSIQFRADICKFMQSVVHGPPLLA